MKKHSPKGKTKSSAKEGHTDNTFPVVAIGASAGGLEAVTELLRNLSPDTGMTFVYVQHLSPDHKSILASLLAKTTSMRVHEVKNKMLLQPNNLYVIPPDKEMTLLDGHIKLSPRLKGRHVTSLPIDTFFTSLAEIHKEGAIGIVLSGSANDGTVGIKAIKDAGGLTFAQDSSAKFNSMPKSAIAAGAVDFILSPKEIALELTRLSKHEYMKRKLFGASPEIENNNPELKKIIQQLVKETSVDFSQYKMATIKRRIYRRMLLNKVKTLKEYVKLISEKEDEIRILFQDLLINVTNFFRDTGMHNYLKSTLFPQMLKKKEEGESLRIWVPACSTGEEVYSIAMTLHELKGNFLQHHPVQIFATDLSEQAILKARIGEYSSEQIKSISPIRLQRFYTKSGDKYRIAKMLREMCVFATHNVLTDPPFSKIDFISCCNLLIYLDANAQAKVLKTFHYSLKADGYLMLGRAESVGRSTELFKRVNNKYKIYLRKYRAGKRTLPGLSGHLLRSNISKKSKLIQQKDKPAELGFDKVIDTILLNRYSPPSVVINYSMDILQFRGATDPFLRHPSGKASLNILKMISPEIAFDLRYAITQAVKTSKPVKKSGIEFKIGTANYIANVEVIPITSEWTEPLLLILFSKAEANEAPLVSDINSKHKSVSKDKVLNRLKKELADARADMLAFARDQEAFNEELQNANEEVVSSNEELQSVNEELETSKEEIESTNEELITTNQELETRNELLNESYGYSEAIINTIHEPMLILDKELRVKSANKSFYQNFKVTEEETEGTFLFDLGNKQWDIPRLRQLLIEIIPNDKNFHDFVVTHTFVDIGKRTMLLNASRIVQKGHGEQLILLAINDITEHTLLQLKEKELLQRDAVESKSLSVKLEKAVEARTKELEFANQNLEEKNLQLEKMNSELEAFAYVSSHDLQEPLRKIQTFASRILETENQNLSEKGKDYFNRMQQASVRMKNLIEDLLAFSHLSIDERKFELTDLNKMVAEVKAEMKEVIDEKKAIIEVHNLCTVNVIPFQFRQLMYNLINNSLKFSKPKLRPLIVIKSNIAEGSKLGKGNFKMDRMYCHISVADNGIGFDQQYKDRIFEVFQKLHGKHEYAGTGIGLAIVKKVVENHNGFVTVSTKINKGATFNIYFPIDNGPDKC